MALIWLCSARTRVLAALMPLVVDPDTDCIVATARLANTQNLHTHTHTDTQIHEKKFKWTFCLPVTAALQMIEQEIAVWQGSKGGHSENQRRNRDI